ncbi:hypothetical protein, partial [Paenibacillus ginsengihumi]
SVTPGESLLTLAATVLGFSPQDASTKHLLKLAKCRPTPCNDLQKDRLIWHAYKQMMQTERHKMMIHSNSSFQVNH